MALKEKIILFIQNFIGEEMEEKIELKYDSKLFGGDGPLDSMALVNLLVDLEDFIEDEYDKSITLADEKSDVEKNKSIFTSKSSYRLY